ncbi:MAG: addiction module antidote protein [Pseudomonadota bacterium]
MALKTAAFNPVDYLQSDEEIADYLTEAYQDDDPAVFVAALGNVVRHKGVARLAKETGLNRESLYKAFNGKSQPKWDTVHRLLHTLGVSVTLAA